MNITSEDLAWLAGIIDGEGTIAVYDYHHTTRCQRVVRLFIYNTDLGIVSECERILKDLDIFYTMWTDMRGKPCYHVRVCRIKDMLRLCGLIKPYIKADSRKAAIQRLEAYKFPSEEA
jgi:hypothetical protein